MILIDDDVYAAVIVTNHWRVHPVHMMNVELRQAAAHSLTLRPSSAVSPLVGYYHLHPTTAVYY